MLFAKVNLGSLLCHPCMQLFSWPEVSSWRTSDLTEEKCPILGMEGKKSHLAYYSLCHPL